METSSEKVFAKLDIQIKSTPYHSIFVFIWWVIVFFCFFYFSFGISTYDPIDENFTSNEWYTGSEFHIWGIEFYAEYYDCYSNEVVKYFTPGAIIAGILITAFLILIPKIISKYLNFITKRCELTLTENQIYGVLKMPFSTKKIQMPVEKMDNIFTLNGIGDKFRSGKTLKICSNSGAVKFHFVRNAEEFAAAAIKRIEEIRKEEKNTQTVIQPQSNNAGSGSLTEKISELQKLKEQGILSQEEFEKKKQELIEKF